MKNLGRIRIKYRTMAFMVIVGTVVWLIISMSSR